MQRPREGLAYIGGKRIDLLHFQPSLVSQAATKRYHRMIIFDLSCNNGHRFEGWFASSDAFDDQLTRGLVSCPVCASEEVRRVPSAVHVARASEVPPPQAATAVAKPRGEMLEAYHRLVSAIIAGSEDVGAEFASEARKIHYLEAPERSIRGQASEQEFEALRDEGIEVFQIPMNKKEKLN